MADYLLSIGQFQRGDISSLAQVKDFEQIFASSPLPKTPSKMDDYNSVKNFDPRPTGGDLQPSMFNPVTDPVLLRFDSFQHRLDEMLKSKARPYAKVQTEIIEKKEDEEVPRPNRVEPLKLNSKKGLFSTQTGFQKTNQVMQPDIFSMTMPSVSIRSNGCLSAAFKARWLLTAVRQKRHHKANKPKLISELQEVVDHPSSNTRDRLLKQQNERLLDEKRRRDQLERERLESLERKRKRHEEWLANRPAWDQSIKVPKPVSVVSPLEEIARLKVSDFKVNFCCDDCNEDCNCYQQDATSKQASQHNSAEKSKGQSSNLIAKDISERVSRENVRDFIGKNSIGTIYEESDSVPFKASYLEMIKKKEREPQAAQKRSPVRKYPDQSYETRDNSKFGVSVSISKDNHHSKEHCSRNGSIDKTKISCFRCNVLELKDYETPHLAELYRARRKERSRSQYLEERRRLNGSLDRPQTGLTNSRFAQSQHTIHDQSVDKKKRAGRKPNPVKTKTITLGNNYTGFLVDNQNSQKFSFSLNKII